MSLSLSIITGLILTGCQTDRPGTDLYFSETSETSEDSNNKIQNTSVQLSDIPEWNGSACIAINNNIPFFNKNDIKTKAYEQYSDLDDYGRPGIAVACLGTETMPAENEKRGDIGMVKPAGWHTVKYPDQISDRYLYNRCHLIGWQLSDENANEKNLFTGTRYINIEGMLPFENKTADYIKTTHNHVMYRVTPIYANTDLVCRGVLMEALSVENQDLSFCVYCYNVQPKIHIDYSDGSSYIENNSLSEKTEMPTESAVNKTYIINTKSKKIHSETCDLAEKISDSNKETYTGNINVLLDEGYTKCKHCNPE